MLKVFFWLRYLRKRKVVFLSIAAVALSTALLIIVSSIFDGFIKKVENAGSDIFGDIYFNPNYPLGEYEELLSSFESLPQVEAAATSVETGGLLRLESGNVKAVRIVGIDPKHYSKVIRFNESLVMGEGEGNIVLDSNLPAGYVGIGVLGKPDEKTDEYDFEAAKKWIGKKVVVTTGSTVERAEGSGNANIQYKPKHLQFVIKDVVFSGIYYKDSSEIFLPEDEISSLVALGENDRSRKAIYIKLAENADAENAKSLILTAWREYAEKQGMPEAKISRVFINTSGEMQEYFIEELRKQVAVLMVVFGVICSAAVLLILCIFYMIVITRQKDIAILKSCGVSSTAVMLVFLGFGGCVGVIGSGFGLLLGSFVTKNINMLENLMRIVFGFKIWKSSVYAFSEIPNQMDWISAMWIICFTIAAAGVGALIPAMIAAMTKPVEILRYE